MNQVTQLTSTVEEKSNIIESLNLQLVEYESQISQLKEANLSLSNEIENLKKQVDEITQKLDELNNEKSTLVEQYSSELESLQGQLSQSHRQLERSQNIVYELEAKLSSESEIQSNLKVFI